MEKQVYLIGEIGQNHNGSVEIAKQIVDLAAKPVFEDLFGISLKGMDAVKMTKRDLKHELSATALRRRRGGHQQTDDVDQSGRVDDDECRAGILR